MSNFSIFAEEEEESAFSVFTEPKESIKEKYTKPHPLRSLAAGVMKSVTGGYLPEIEATRVSKEAFPTQAKIGEFVGFAAPIGVAGKVSKVAGLAKPLSKEMAKRVLPKVARGLKRGAITGTVYGGGRKPEEGEDRLTNALYDAVLFSGFDGALSVLGHYGAKVIARFKSRATGAEKPEQMVEIAKEAIGDASTRNVMEALKKAKPLRGKQEALYMEERGKRLAKSMGIGEKVRGEAGFYAEKGQLKGELPKVQFESVRGELPQADIDNVFNTVKDSPFITEWEKISAREGLAKLFGQQGGKLPTHGEIKLLNTVFGKEFTDAIISKRPLWQKIKEGGLQLMNIPRSVMSSFDLSFGLRQGAFVAPKFRKEFFASFKKQFRVFGSEKAYKELMNSIAKDPYHKLARESRVAFTEMDNVMGLREERFMSQWAEKIPIVGRGIRASGRAYTGFANKLRMDIFRSLVEDAQRAGLNPESNQYLLRKMADFVNTGTGRGSLKSLEGASLALNSFFFSPRLMSSRLKLLNPVYYVNPKTPKFVRTQALKSLLGFAGAVTTILGIGKLAGLEVETDPRNSDFAKLKIGRTRIDILGGFQPYIRAAAQLITGKYISSVTGKEVTLGEGYKPLTRLDILTRQIESKEAPFFSFVTELMKGQDYQGDPVNVPKAAGERFKPMVIGDIIDLAKEDPKLIPLGALAVFGVGLQTYESYPEEVREFYNAGWSEEADDPLEQELWALKDRMGKDFSMPRMPKRGEMESKDYYNAVVGDVESNKIALNKLIRAPMWRFWSDSLKVKNIKKIISQERQIAKQ